ncbi:monooxygenase [Paraliomyxa miuraensis]|uniref:monooxygenase n=1 Tax=Paraliomyxa miuraensis TaxID=376150 RepID=UPI002253180A|nr:hypothetical protein [Paraliomyxa miuraensis]MCX4246439.1 hypothetical protein [Paraliomyxa miuraensis]
MRRTKLLRTSTKHLRLSTWTLCVLSSLAAQACREDQPATDDGADSGTTEASATGGVDSTGTETDAVLDETGTEATPTFWDDVAPILYERCVGCHREGGIGPMRLDDYESASAWAPVSVNAMQDRTMPPWLVTDDGSCGEFQHSKWMPPDEIDRIAAWLAAGTPEGQPRDDLSLPEPEQLTGVTEIGTPNFVPEIQGGDLAEFDEYRCFLVDPMLEGDRFLTGYDVLPGNEAIVHHVLVMPVDPDLPVGGGMTNADVMQALDDESPTRDGWPCFGEAGDGVEVSGIPVVWAPGQGIVRFPEGTGLRVRQGEQLVIQMHYNLANPTTIGMSDQSTVALRLEEEVEREGFMILPDPFLGSIFEGDPIELPPGEPSVEFTWEMPVGEMLGWFGLPGVDLYGVFPHMHEYGRSIDMHIDGPSGSECAAEVRNWDFHWQLQYFFQQPRALQPDEVLRVTCDFDTVGADEPVLPGWGTHNEMCLMGLYLVP